MSREEDLMKESLKEIRAGKKITATEPVDLPVGVRITRQGTYLLPNSPAQRADILYDCTRLRLDLQHRVDKLKELESELNNYFIDTLSKNDATGIAGQVARVQVKPNPIPTVTDWKKFYKYVRQNNAFDLLQRRLSMDAVKGRLDNKVRLPGVGIFQAKKVSVTLIK